MIEDTDVSDVLRRAGLSGKRAEREAKIRDVEIDLIFDGTGVAFAGLLDDAIAVGIGGGGTDGGFEAAEIVQGMPAILRFRGNEFAIQRQRTGGKLPERPIDVGGDRLSIGGVVDAVERAGIEKELFFEG